MWVVINVKYYKLSLLVARVVHIFTGSIYDTGGEYCVYLVNTATTSTATTSTATTSTTTTAAAAAAAAATQEVPQRKAGLSSAKYDLEICGGKHRPWGGGVTTYG